MGDKLHGDGLIAHQQDIDAHMADLHQFIRTGEYHFSPRTSSTDSTALVANMLYAIPYFCARAMTIDRLQGRVMTAAADTEARLGIYKNGSNFYPGDLLLDAGVMSTATTGYKDIIINQSLPKGIYFIVIVSDGALTFRSMHYAYAVTDLLSLEMPPTTYVLWQVAYTYGSLPSSYPAGGAKAIMGGFLPALRVASLD